MAKSETAEAVTDQAQGAATGSGSGSATRSRRTSNSKPSNKAPKNRVMSKEHKEALRVGREEGRVVNQYLEAIESHKPKRGRRVTRATMVERIEKLNKEQIPQAEGAEKLALIQQRMDYEAALRRMEDTTVITDLEEAFKKVAKSYAERRGITYDAFREIGVPPAVLKSAGMQRKSA